MMAYFDGIKRVQLGSDGGLDTNGAKVAGVGHDINVYYNIEGERLEENKDEFTSPGAVGTENSITIIEDGAGITAPTDELKSNDNYVFIAQNPKWDDVKTDTSGDGEADTPNDLMSSLKAKHIPAT
jgi:hypothetical protein